MPVTFVPPIDNLFVGPGAQIGVSTDFIGPLPTGSRWELLIGPVGGEGIIGEAGFAPASHQSTLFVSLTKTETTGLKPIWHPQLPAAASPVQQSVAIARLFSGTNTVIDQGSTPVQWRAEPAGVAYVQAQGAATSGGFSDVDRSVLNTILPAVRTLFPSAVPGGAQLAAQVIDLVRGPPRSLLRPFGTLLLTGRGTFSAQPPGALHSFGGTWQVAEIPAGYGKDDGTVTEWHRRIGQLAVIREGAGDDLYIDVLEDTHRGNDFILWQFPNPSQINYDIAPGVTILWEWLV